jgi:uncharacterized protein
MRKRLRKKKHMGEFQEWGVEFELTVKPGVDFDAFCDDFIDECIESRELAFGGGGGEMKLKGFIELGRSDVHLANLAHVAAWFANSASIESYSIGEPLDAWE